MDQCSSCRFFERRTFTTRITIGGRECRRRPPVPPFNSQDQDYPDFGVFPSVMEDDWCGEFAPRRNTPAHRRDIEANAAFDAASHEDATDAAVCDFAGNV